MLVITQVMLRVVWFLVHAGGISLFIRDLPIGVLFVVDHKSTHNDVSVVRRVNESRYLRNEFLVRDFQTLLEGLRFQMVRRENGKKGVMVYNGENEELDFTTLTLSES